MKMYYFKRPKYTSPHTYACISIHILAFPRSGGYFYLPRPLTVTHWSLPSQINFFHKIYSLFLNTVKTNNTFFPQSYDTALLAGTILIEFVQTRNSNALFRTAWRQRHLPYPHFRPTYASTKKPL